VTDPDQPGDLSRTVARGAGVAGLGGLLLQLVTLAAYILLARLAPPVVFGTFAAATILVTIGTLFVESGMTAALIHRHDRLEEAAATAFVSTLLGGVLLTLLSAALAPLVGLFFEGDDITEVALAISGMHLLNATTVVPDALLQRRFSYVRRAIVDPLWIGSYGAVAAVALASGLGVWGLVIATYASGVVRVTLVWAFARWRPSLRLASMAMWRELAGYARHVLASEFLRHLGVIARTAGIGRFLGTADLAQFNFGNRIATQAGAPIVTASAYVLFPAFARISSDRERMAHAFRRSLYSLCFLSVPVSLAFFPFGEPLAVLLLGASWEPAGEVLTSLCLVGAALALISISAEVFKATGRPDLLPRMHLLSALAPIVAVVVGVSYGVVAIGAATSVGMAAVAAVGVLAACRVTGVRSRVAADGVLVPAAIAGAIAAVFYIVEHRFAESASRGTALGLALLATEAAGAGALYLLAMRLAAPDRTREFFSAFRHLRRSSRPSAKASG